MRGAPANDIALDDITFRPCGPIVTAEFSETSSNTETICEGSDATIELKGILSSGYTDPQYQ